MVSKPKPGLGKGLVRTIQHGSQHSHTIPLPTVTASTKDKLPTFPDLDSILHRRPLRHYTTLSASRPFDVLPLFCQSSMDIGFRRDATFNFSELHPPLPPPSPGPPHVPLPPSHIHNVPGHSAVTAFAPRGLLLDAPGIARDIDTTLPSSILHTYPAYASKLIFRYGSYGVAKDRPNTPPRRTKSNSPTPPPRPRSFPLPEVDSPTSFTSSSIGEDAYFARSDGMCVADGVGGWARSGRGGADAGRWSRLLTHFCQAEMRRWWEGKDEYLEALNGTGDAWAEKFFSGKIRMTAKIKRDDAAGLPSGLTRRKLNPVEIMQRGFEKCLSCFLKEGIHGSSTCLLALLHHSTLLIANLGDCSLLVVRDGEIIFRTDEMQHAFNFPLQLGTHSRDEPMKDARQYDVRVEKDDVVVVGSDGLMDNLFEDEIVECLAEFAAPAERAPSKPAFDPQKVSEALCHAARQKSEDLTSETPFMLRAAAEGIDFVGGKKDDITVIVGVIGARADGMADDRFKTS